MDDQQCGHYLREANGNGFSLSFRPKFSQHIVFSVKDVTQGKQSTYILGVPRLTKNMVLVAKPHTLDTLRFILGVGCIADGVLNIRTGAEVAFDKLELDFTIIAL